MCSDIRFLDTLRLRCQRLSVTGGRSTTERKVAVVFVFPLMLEVGPMCLKKPLAYFKGLVPNGRLVISTDRCPSFRWNNLRLVNQQFKVAHVTLDKWLRIALSKRVQVFSYGI